MAQAATMGPPLSPRETRRSGRRSAPSASASTSKSPDSQASESAPRSKDVSHRPSLSTSTSSNRSRKFKQEDQEGSVDDNQKVPATNGSASAHGNGNGRAKRKGKDKDKLKPQLDLVELDVLRTGASVDDASMDAPEEEQGITRCVCGSTGEDDPDAGEFMVQCETCTAWQHGLCMGYEAEDQLPDDDYHCEQCRPDLHQELLKKLSKKGRHSSANSHHNSVVTSSRLSRSHSPSHLLKQPAKRRNTMNSRDAAFDESLKELIEATAAEAAAQDTKTPNGTSNGHAEPEEVEIGQGSRKKRKRAEDDAVPKKRTRSASTTSDRPIPSNAVRDDTPVTNGISKSIASSAPPAKPNTTRNRRGGTRKAVAAQDAPIPEGEEAAPPPSRRSHNSRTKGSSSSRRPPASSTAHAPGSVSHEHSTRRNHANATNGSGGHGSTSAEAIRAYRNSHAYAVSQQPLFTSWNLPDYLAHLEHMLPTKVPLPLEVRGSGADGRDSMERTIERGVKVKWPSKRMSVGDMNKRVRSLVEWVGREQAGAMDRGRRREALEKTLKMEKLLIDSNENYNSVAGPSQLNGVPVLDVGIAVQSPVQEKDTASMEVDGDLADSARRSSTMKMMEELMAELINFQERFGPGAKNKERERRLAAA